MSELPDTEKLLPVAGHADSLVPAGKTWKLVWSDEFDGDTLDTSKWGFRSDFWGRRSPTFTEEGVRVSDGSLKIDLIRKGDDFYSAHLQTGSLTFDHPKDSRGFWPFGKMEQPKFMHRYGYYEIRCRLPKNDGWHAAFWLQSPSVGVHPDPRQCGVECDIMENYRQATEGKIICGCGWNGYGQDSRWYGHFQFPYIETQDGWHYYGVDWSEDGYIFYADGKEVGRQMEPDCPASHVDQFILVSTECHGYNRVFANEDADASAFGDRSVWHGKPVEALFRAVLPDCFEVDFVRVFDEIKA